MVSLRVFFFFLLYSSVHSYHHSKKSSYHVKYDIEDSLTRNKDVNRSRTGTTQLHKKRTHHKIHKETDSLDIAFILKDRQVNESTDSHVLDQFQQVFREMEEGEKSIAQVFDKEAKTGKQKCKTKYTKLKELFINSKEHEKEELKKLKRLRSGLSDIIRLFKETEERISTAKEESLEMEGELRSLKTQLSLAESLDLQVSALQQNAKLNYATGKLELAEKQDLLPLGAVKRIEETVNDPAVLIVDIRLLLDSAALLCVASIGGVASGIFGLPSLIGYILGGSIVGPNMLDLICSKREIHTLSQFGSIFFLFAHGLEQRLPQGKMKWKQPLFSFVLTTLAITLLFCLVFTHLKVAELPSEAILAGFSVSVSSLTVVMGVLSELHLLEQAEGQFIQSYMTIQGLVMALVFGLPSFSVTVEAITMMAVFFLVLLVIALVSENRTKAIIFFIGSYFSQTEEMYVLGVVSFAMSCALLTEVCGLSLDLGAFIGGFLFKKLSKSHTAARIVQPLTSVFSALLFASIGMLINPLFVYNNFGVLAMLLGLTFSSKFIIISRILRYFGGEKVSYVGGISMCHVGEFSLLFTSKLHYFHWISRRLYLLLLSTTIATLLASVAFGKYVGSTRINQTGRLPLRLTV